MINMIKLLQMKIFKVLSIILINHNFLEELDTVILLKIH